MQKNKEARQNVAVQALFAASGTFASRVLGLVRERFLGAYFDRTVTDAWIAAFRLPNLFRRMLGEGALGVNFIPVFVGLITPKKDGTQAPRTEAEKLVNGMFTILLGFLTILTILGILFAEDILVLMAGGKGVMQIPGKFELTVKLARIMFAYILLVSLYAYFMAILNTLGKFGLAAFAPTLFNVVLIAGTLVPESYGGGDGEVMAWAVIIGGIVQVAILIPQLMRTGYFPKITWPAFNQYVGSVISTTIPSWIGMGIMQLTLIVNMRFASELEEGTQSWINWADRILELPLSLVAVALGSALLPQLTRHWASGDREGMFEISNHYLRLTLFVALPAGLGCWFLSESIMYVLFHSGKFGARDLEMTSEILKIYAPAIMSYGAIRILVIPFYAVKNTWLPASVSGIALLAHIAIAMHLTQVYGPIGLALSTVLSSLVNLTLLMAAHYWLLGPLGLKKMALALGKFAIAGAGMFAILRLHPKLISSLEGVPWHHGVALILTGTSSLFAYLLISALLKTEEFHETFETFASKIRRRLKKSS